MGKSKTINRLIAGNEAFFFIRLLSVSISELRFAADSDSLKYVNATDFQLIGKEFTDTENIYERLPLSLKEKTRPPVWWSSKNCSGLTIRFRTNSPIIAAKWELTDDISYEPLCTHRN